MILEGPWTFQLYSARPETAPAWIPSSSVTEAWSAQTWTLGTVFTHILVTCKPPCRKHKIYLIYPPFTSLWLCSTNKLKKRKKEGREGEEKKKAIEEIWVWSSSLQVKTKSTESPRDLWGSLQLSLLSFRWVEEDRMDKTEEGWQGKGCEKQQ